MDAFDVVFAVVALPAALGRGAGAKVPAAGSHAVARRMSFGTQTVEDRDRFAHESASLYYLREEFGQHGRRLRALSDRGDDSPEGQLIDDILDQIACFERIKIAEGSRRIKVRNAREGKIVAPHTPTYGFKLNVARDADKVNEAEMNILRRIFRMTGSEGRTLGSLARVLEKQGVSSCKGIKR